ncbi:MAG: hypothetical protein JOZ15_09150, partial [Acidobacteria bacterium]|nr:hypothetical protein [Acidobacteriota bacterium]
MGGFARWLHREIAAAHPAGPESPAQEPSREARALHRIEMGSVATLGVASGLGLALYVLLVRRSHELANLLEGALAGQRLPMPRVKDEFAVTFKAADRVGQELATERERTAQARQRLDTLSMLMDLGVVLVSPTRELDFANLRARELLGCAGPAELERHWPEILPLLEPALQPAPRRAGRLNPDVVVPGGPRALRCVAYTVAEEERQSFLLLLRDRIVLDALETDLLLASQLRALTRVYSAVTHELKAPLNAMVLNLELLQDALRRGEGAREAEQSEQYLDVLREELARLERSLDALLTETTPAGRRHEEFDVRAMVREIERLLTPQARLQRVTLAAHLPERAVLIAGQRDRLKQAILNVAINALEAMADGGTLELRLEARAEQAEVLITDSGPGIPEELRPRIFDLHFTTKTSGSGIGLYVARSI